MDPRHSAQDIHRCDLCETAIVHSYCDFCHVNLCKPCVADHISDGYSKHALVPFKDRRSTLIYPKCEVHPHKSCDLQCKDCNIFICTSCVGSKLHKRHDFLELNDIYKTKKENIKKDANELKNIISPSYQEIAHDLENHLANLDKGYEKLTIEMSKQGEELNREIDLVKEKLKTEISEIKIKHKDILKKELKGIEQIQSLIQQTEHSLKEIEESTEVSLTIEYSSKIRDFSKLPPKFQATMPTFIPKPIDRRKLYSMYGQITPFYNDTEGNALSLSRGTTSDRELLDEPEVVASIQTEFIELYNVIYVNEEMIWASGETDDIKSFNIKGLLLHTIKTKSGAYPNDIAVDSDGNLLYTDGSKKTVYKVKNGQTEELITLQNWVPYNLCVTCSGDLLVTLHSDDGTQSKVVRYSGSTEKQTIQFDGEGKPLYSRHLYHKYITENRNHDICVADWKACAIVVVNQDGLLRWRYTGHPSTTKNECFQPMGITTDSQSRILTTDNDNQCITILDQNGQFLRYIDNCDLISPCGLCVDNDDSLFVCLFVCDIGCGIMKKIKY